MDPVTKALILDLIEWLAAGDRSYDKVMAAWRTSCPKLPVWEDANDGGLVRSVHVNGQCIIQATPAGLDLLCRERKSH
jgi:hypothetical protein